MTLIVVEWLSVPNSGLERFQVTPASAGSFVTIAVKVCDPPLVTDAPAGLTVTLMGGGVEVPMPPLPPLPQSVRKTRVDNPQKTTRRTIRTDFVPFPGIASSKNLTSCRQLTNQSISESTLGLRGKHHEQEWRKHYPGT